VKNSSEGGDFHGGRKIRRGEEEIQCSKNGRDYPEKAEAFIKETVFILSISEGVEKGHRVSKL